MLKDGSCMCCLLDDGRGGKLEALEYVRTLYNVPKERCVAAGDSGNDILMLAGEVRLPMPPYLTLPCLCNQPTH